MGMPPGDSSGRAARAPGGYGREDAESSRRPSWRCRQAAAKLIEHLESGRPMLEVEGSTLRTAVVRPPNRSGLPIDVTHDAGWQHALRDDLFGGQSLEFSSPPAPSSCGKDRSKGHSTLPTSPLSSCRNGRQIGKMIAVTLNRLFQPPERSFLLLGPRGVGKSFWLRKTLAQPITFDLLETRLQFEFARQPSQLEARIGRPPPRTWIWLDEVQKVPALMDEVHRLIETRSWRFALSGSSARKLRRQGANLLAGRASIRHLEALAWPELNNTLSLEETLLWGTLPLVVTERGAARDILSAYAGTYIREEIKEEGVVRRVEPFLRFLEIAGQLNGQAINTTAIAAEAGVPRRSVDGYFEILIDTLVGHWLPAYQPGAKVREVARPKFYWFDPGVARAAAGRLDETPDPLWLGVALETSVFRELRVHAQQTGREPRLCYYRTRSGAEIDFIIELERKSVTRPARVVCVEVKRTSRWNRAWETPMRELASSGSVRVAARYGVYCGDARYEYDGLMVLPWADFMERLHAGAVF